METDYRSLYKNKVKKCGVFSVYLSVCLHFLPMYISPE